MMKKIIMIIVGTFLVCGCSFNFTNDTQDVEKMQDEKVVVSITDETEEGDVCATALEQIYQDDNYTYYLPCMKSDMIIVEYSDGTTQNVIEALNDGSIKISDLDAYEIKYYSEEK